MVYSGPHESLSVLPSEVRNSHRSEAPPSYGMQTAKVAALVLGCLLMAIVIVNLVGIDAFLIHALESK